MHSESRPILNGTDGCVLQFALTGVFFGVFANWAWALRTAGPIFLWAWVLGGIFQLTVALCFGDLARTSPQSGDRWPRWSSPSRLAWFTGYLLLIGSLAAIADGAYRLAGFVLPFAGVTQYSHHQRVALALLCLVLQSPWSLCSLRRVIRHVRLAVGLTVIGTGCLVVGLTLLGLHQGPAFLFSTTASAEHEHMPRFLIALLVPVSVLTGFHAPASMARLFRNPRRLVPRAIVTGTGSAFLIGTPLLLVPLLVLEAIPPFPSTLLAVVQAHLGSRVGLFAEALIVTSLWFRVVVLQSIAARLLQAHAALGGVPRRLRQAPRTQQGLSLPVVLSCLLIPAIVCVALPDASSLTFVWPALWALAYGILIAGGVWGTLTGRLPKDQRRHVDRCRMTLRLLALGWSIGVAVLIPVLDVGRGVPMVVVILLLGIGLSVRQRKPPHEAGPRQHSI